MQDDTNSQSTDSPTDNNQAAPVQPQSTTGGQKVIQPSPELTQQQVPQVVTGSESQQPTQPTVPQSVYLQPSIPPNGQMQVGKSASQMGWNQSKTSSFDFKKLVVKSVVILAVLGGVFAALVFTNIIALSQLKTISYTNSSGTHYSLTFYTKHTTKTLKSGNTELVSKVSEGGNYPLTLSIASGPISELDKNGIKTCGGPLPKVFDIQNNNLNQQISVCSFPSTNGEPVGVYVMGFATNNQANIVTISQDLSSENTSNQSAAQQSLAKFGLDPYQDDIKQIVASIKVN